MPPLSPPLLILDIDETLIYSQEGPLARAADFEIGPYACYRRPHLDLFLQVAARHFSLAIWTTSSAAYARRVVDELFSPPLEPLFVWSRQACVRQLHSTLGVEIWVKDLTRVLDEGHTLERLLIVEDSPEKVCRQPENLLLVSLYTGASDDDELLQLAAYLPTLALAPDLRVVDKRRWREARPNVSLSDLER